MATHKFTTCLWFDGKAEEAAKHYTSIFKDGKMGDITHYEKEGFEFHHQPEGAVMTVEFTLNGQDFMGLNGGPIFKFNEAVSMVINVDTQEEIDYYSEKLTEGGEQGPCGWVKDKFGFSWQVNPVELTEMLKDPDKEKVARVTNAYLHMKKFDLQKLRDAFNGK